MSVCDCGRFEDPPVQDENRNWHTLRQCPQIGRSTPRA